MSWPTLMEPSRMKPPPNHMMQTMQTYMTSWKEGMFSTARRKVSVLASLSSVLTSSNCWFSQSPRTKALMTRMAVRPSWMRLFRWSTALC